MIRRTFIYNKKSSNQSKSGLVHTRSCKIEGGNLTRTEKCPGYKDEFERHGKKTSVKKGKCVKSENYSV